MPGLHHPHRSLTGYVDDRLPPWRRRVVERHVRGCTRCALDVASARALRRLLAGAPVPEPPPALRERLLAIGRPEPDPAPRPVERVLARPLVGAAAVLSAALLVAGAAATGAVVTGATTPWPGDAPRASLVTVLPRLLPWTGDPAQRSPADEPTMVAVPDERP